MSRMFTAAAAVLAFGALTAAPASAQQNQQGQGQGQMPSKQQMQQMHQQMQGQMQGQQMQGQTPDQMRHQMYEQMHGQMQERTQARALDQQGSSRGAPLYISPAGVQAVQQTLKDAGYDIGEADGTWGPRTSAALREFQQVHGLEPTGNLNLVTITTLGLAIGPAPQQAETPQAGEGPQGGGQAQ